MSRKQKHILVIRLSAMGDVAMTVPVLRAFCNTYPNVKLTVLTRGFFTPFFRDLPNINVFSPDLKGRHKGVLGLYKLSKELKSLKIDTVADLHNVLRTKILKFFFFGSGFVKIDKGRASKKALVKGKTFEQLKTTHQRYADVFKALGYPIDLSNPTFPEIKPLSDNVKELIGTSEKPIIAIAPFAQYESKMYPLPLMKEVIEELQKDYKVLLFGGGVHEIKQLESLATNYNAVINLAGKLSLDEELGVISNCRVMLSMDSGNGHIAAMLGKKVITIWGVTHPFAGFTPFNQPKTHQLLASKEQFPQIPTSVYGNKYPEDYKLATSSILPKTIVDTIKKVIE